MNTGIAPLDRLIGSRGRSVAQRSAPQAMLVRGAPGSGKTTLSLQMMDHHLAHVVGRDARGSPLRGVLISLETDPELAWQTVMARLDPKRAREREAWRASGALRLIGRDELEEKLTPSQPKNVIKKLGRFLTTEVGMLSHGLVIIDSINLLADIIQPLVQSPERPADIRAVMFGIWTQLEKYKDDSGGRGGGSNLILIGEHHPGAPYDVSLLSESFACDIELLLSAEPIAGTPTIAANLLGPLGYAYERRQSTGAPREGPQSIEIRSFCRVLKSRYLPNQSRRCAYDIVEGQGVVFNETYPGDGEVLLFHENVKQETAWQEFVSRDLPLQFPALRYTLFDRPAMQRTFATQRRYNQLHQKTDMHLACFDSYWVNWYSQLGQRAAIRDTLRPLLPDIEGLSDADREARARQLCAFDERIGRYLDSWEVREIERERAACVRDLKALINPAVLAMSPRPPTKVLDEMLDTAFRELLDRLENIRQVGLLRPIPKDKLRLFGECRSRIFSEMDAAPDLREQETTAKRQERQSAQAVQVFLPRFCRDGSHYLTVPYNANVSFLVRREELLHRRLAAFNALENRAYWRRELQKLLEREHAAVARFVSLQGEHFKQRWTSGEWDSVERSSRFIAPAIRALPPDAPATYDTWEEILLLCQGSPDGSEELRQQYQLLIETQTFDSFLCVFLEFVRATGRELVINPKYELKDPIQTEQSLFQALWLLREFFRLGIVEKYSSVEPRQFTQRFPNPASATGPDEPRSDWLFARHWYSTLVDVLSAIDPARGDFWWKPSGVQLNVGALPWSLCSQLQGAEPTPVASWGEWHFAVLQGSENEELAIELINNFMSSQRICERAARCAALPTVEQFYLRYQNVPMLRLYERSGPNVKLPTMTYGQLRKTIFKVARSRKCIFDYRHCMRELHPILTMVQHDHDVHVEDDDLAAHVLQAVDRIRRHQSQELLLH